MTCHLPADLGSICWADTIVNYRLVDEIEIRTEPYQAGGSITHHVATGRRCIVANECGRAPDIELTPELRAAIERDLQKRGITL